MKAKALIVVDIQKDFLPGGSLAVSSGHEVIPGTNQMIHLKRKFFDLVVATQDWHPKNHQSFASQHPGRHPGEQIELLGLPQVLWPDHCIQNSQGAALSSALDFKNFDFIVQKGTDIDIDSYSGFFDNGRRKATPMADYLKNQEIRDVYILGLATDYCVQFTALDAVSLGFRTYLIEDCCRGVNLHPDDSKKSVNRMKEAGIQIIYSSELISTASLK